MKIYVDGKYKELAMIDRNGIDVAEELIDGNVDYDEDKECFVMTKEEYEWWEQKAEKFWQSETLLNEIENYKNHLGFDIAGIKWFEYIDDENRTISYDNIRPFEQTDLDPLENFIVEIDFMDETTYNKTVLSGAPQHADFKELYDDEYAKVMVVMLIWDSDIM